MFRTVKLLIIMAFCGSLQARERELVDTIRVVIFGEDGTEIITYSDVLRPSLEGVMRSLDEIILERLILLDAKKMKILPDEAAIDRYLENVQREHNLTLDQLKHIFKNAGYSFQEGRRQFGILTTINSLLDYKIRSRLLIPSREIEKYYNENPQTVEASYYIEKAFVPFSSSISTTELKKKLSKFAKHEGPFELTWSEPFWIDESDLADERRFITLMNVDQISMPQEVDGGFELFRLKDKKPQHLKPMAERTQEISEILRKPRYDFLFDEYKKELFGSASILYLDEN